MKQENNDQYQIANMEKKRSKEAMLDFEDALVLIRTKEEKERRAAWLAVGIAGISFIFAIGLLIFAATAGVSRAEWVTTLGTTVIYILMAPLAVALIALAAFTVISNKNRFHWIIGLDGTALKECQWSAVLKRMETQNAALFVDKVWISEKELTQYVADYRSNLEDIMMENNRRAESLRSELDVETQATYQNQQKVFEEMVYYYTEANEQTPEKLKKEREQAARMEMEANASKPEAESSETKSHEPQSDGISARPDIQEFGNSSISFTDQYRIDGLSETGTSWDESLSVDNNTQQQMDSLSTRESVDRLFSETLEAQYREQVEEQQRLTQIEMIDRDLFRMKRLSTEQMDREAIVRKKQSKKDFAKKTLLTLNVLYGLVILFCVLINAAVSLSVGAMGILMNIFASLASTFLLNPLVILIVAVIDIKLIYDVYNAFFVDAKEMEKMDATVVAKLPEQLKLTYRTTPRVKVDQYLSLSSGYLNYLEMERIHMQDRREELLHKKNS